MKKSKIISAAWFLFVVLSFALLAQFSISIGDDLGYMFTDSALHKCDGKIINSLAECFSTQVNHYFSTNGRFLVHCATHFFVSIAGLDLFRFANAFMFGLLWLLILEFLPSKNSDVRWFSHLLVLFMLWVFMPDVGTTMLSLVAFAINYMWSAVAYLAFLRLLKKCNSEGSVFRSDSFKFILFSFLAIVVGSLQESYSIPIGIALFIMLVRYFKRIKTLTLIMIISFLVGCCIGIFAPGNFQHAVQGGGFSIDNIIRKSAFLFEGVLFSPIILMVAMIMLSCLCNFRMTRKFIDENIFFFIAIIASVLFATITYTSPRQLFCPSVFSIIVIGRIVPLLKPSKLCKQVLSVIFSLFLAFIFIMGYVIRKNTFEVYNSQIINKLGGKSTSLFIDSSEAYHNHNNLFIRSFAKRYAPDPLANESLHLLFDGYSKRGLSRLYWDNGKTDNLKNIIPYAPNAIEKIFTNQSDACRRINDKILKSKTFRLDSRYKAVRISKTIDNYFRFKPFASTTDNRVLPYETLDYSGYVYFILPESVADTIILKHAKAKVKK